VAKSCNLVTITLDSTKTKSQIPIALSKVKQKVVSESKNTQLDDQIPCNKKRNLLPLSQIFKTTSHPNNKLKADAIQLTDQDYDRSDEGSEIDQSEDSDLHSLQQQKPETYVSAKPAKSSFPSV